MVRKMLIAAALAAVALPATSAAGPPTRIDRTNAATACASLQRSLGAETFGLTYRTYGRCVSAWIAAAHGARHAAQAACRATARRKGAFGRCVSARTRALVTARVATTRNAAQACKAELDAMGEARFNTAYGTNASDANAFGKCVSTRNRTWHFTAELSQLNDSGVSGTARLTLRRDRMTVRLQARGLEASKLHPQHVHGLAAGGNATCPTATADANHDGIVTFAEGLPFYGAVLVELAPFPTANAGGQVSYEQTLTVDRSAILPLANRTIVLHGKTVGGAYDATLPVACGEIELGNR